MVDLPELRKHLSALDEADETALREALAALKQHAEKDWAEAPAEAVHAAVAALKARLQKVRLLNGTRQPAVQKSVATVLGNMGPRSKAALPQLIELLQAGVPDPVREAAAAALGRMGKEAVPAVGALVALLADSRPALCAQAVRALGDIGCADARVRNALTALWPSPPQLQGATAQVATALCKLGIDAPGLLGAVTRALVSGQEAAARRAAAEALSWCDPGETDVVPALLTATLKDTNEDVRRAAQAGLDRMRLSHEAAVRVCAEQLGDSVFAEEALRKSGAVAVPVLAEALRKGGPEARLKAARTLGGIGPAAVEAAPALTAALRGGDPELHLAAAKGLWAVTGTADAAVPALIGLLEGAGAAGAGVGEARRRFLQTVMEALGRIGHAAQAAVPALTALSRDKNRHIQESAQSALQGIRPTSPKNAGTRR